MNEEKDIEIVAQEIQEAILKEARKIYSPKVIELSQYPGNLGVIEKANGFGIIKGICGDTMKIYLRIVRGRVKEAKFETDGCGPTLACGSAITGMARGKTLKQVLKLSPSDVLKELGGLPESHLHCSILAVNALHSAVANYLFLNQDQPKPE
ncbi:MAG: iron-sulfur cluster assembly scaffold protein [PVC group bacterium]